MSKEQHDEHLPTTSWLQAGEGRCPPSNPQQTAATGFTGSLSRQAIVQYIEDALRIIQDDDDDDEKELRQDYDTPSVPPPPSQGSSDS
jgi:hypothetical protein